MERLIESRFSLGQVRANELYQQRESTQSIAQLKIENDTNLEVLEKRLDVLLGKVPDSSARVKAQIVPVSLASINAVKPEDLIKHRADIRAGYARLQQAASLAGICFTERLPSLQVVANLTSLSQMASTAKWVGYGLDLTIPIFSSGRLLGLEHQSLQVLEEERQVYLELWLAALEEVGRLKSQYKHQQAVIDSLEKCLGYARHALDAAPNRYLLGDQNYLEVLIAIRGMQNADRFLISEQLRLVILWVRTVEAVGQPSCRDSECQES